MKWVFLHFPRLAINSHINGRYVRSKNIAITLHNKIMCLSKHLENQGIEIGQSIAIAQALCSDIECIDYNVESDLVFLNTCAEFCMQFTPIITIKNNWNGIAIEVSRSEHLFGGLKNLIEKLKVLMQEIWMEKTSYENCMLISSDLELQIGVYHTIIGAYLLRHEYEHVLNSKDSNAKLNCVKIHHLPIPQYDCEKLLRLGVTNLGQIFKLPSVSLRKRLSIECFNVLDQIKGHISEQYKKFTIKSEFNQIFLIEGMANNFDNISLPMKDLLLKLTQYLITTQKICRSLVWSIVFCDKTNHDVIVNYSNNDLDQELLFELSKLSFFKTVFNKKFQYKSINYLKLSCSDFEFIRCKQNILFADESSGEDWRKSLLIFSDRVRAKFGNECLKYLLHTQDHLPEKQVHLGKYLKTITTRNFINNPFSPTWILLTPIEIGSSKDALSWQGDIFLIQELERIDGEWWQQRRCRDYFIARKATGEVIWVYRDNLSKSWFLQGLFG